MYILGLNIGHNATACLVKDGEIKRCVSEERFSRIKNHCGVPFQSIEWILKEEKISISDLDLIVFDGHYHLFLNPDFGKQFLEAYVNQHLLKKIFAEIGYKFPNFLYTNLFYLFLFV